MRTTKAFYGVFNIIVDDKNEALQNDSELMKDDGNRTITVTIDCFLNMLSQGVLTRQNGCYLEKEKIERFMKDLKTLNLNKSKNC